MTTTQTVPDLDGFSVHYTRSKRTAELYVTITRAYGTTVAGHCTCLGATHRGRCKHLTSAGVSVFDAGLADDLVARLGTELGVRVVA